MSQKNKTTGKQKLILMVEDKLPPTSDILLSIQNILAVAGKRNLRNAPKNNDTEIQILHLIGSDKTADRDCFQRIKRTLEARQQDQDGIPKISFKYEPLSLDTEQYPKNCTECADKVIERISKICNGKNYSIILDVILFEGKDQSEILQKENGGKILSQQIYNSFHQHCIPYTNYDFQGMQFREAWKESVDPPVYPYERYCIDGNVTYKPFRDLLYRQLGIGGDQ